MQLDVARHIEILNVVRVKCHFCLLFLLYHSKLFNLYRAETKKVSAFLLLVVTCFVLTEIKKTVDCCWVQMLELETTQKYFGHLCEFCSFDDD